MKRKKEELDEIKELVKLLNDCEKYIEESAKAKGVNPALRDLASEIKEAIKKYKSLLKEKDDDTKKM